MSMLSMPLLNLFNDFVSEHLGLNFAPQRWSDLQRGIHSAAGEFGFDICSVVRERNFAVAGLGICLFGVGPGVGGLGALGRKRRAGSFSGRDFAGGAVGRCGVRR